MAEKTQQREQNKEIEDGDELDAERVQALYPSDTGTLKAEIRQVLVNLLRGPYFERSKSRKMWDELKRHENIIRSRLADLYVDLFLDDDLGVAFCRKPELGEHEAPSLLNKKRLGYLDSVVLLELRERLMQADAKGERAWIAKKEIHDILQVFDRDAEQDGQKVDNHLRGICNRLKEQGVLLPLKTSETMEISPVLGLLFTASDIQNLKEAYVKRRMNVTNEPELTAEKYRRYQDWKNRNGRQAEQQEKHPDEEAAEESQSDAVGEQS